MAVSQGRVVFSVRCTTVRAGGLEKLKRVSSPLDAVRVLDIGYALIVEVLHYVEVLHC